MAKHRINQDPEVRESCDLCRGPIFIDEPMGINCPDCLQVLANIARVNKMTPNQQLPRAARAMKTHLRKGG